jgi:hypothetical protein
MPDSAGPIHRAAARMPVSAHGAPTEVAPSEACAPAPGRLTSGRIPGPVTCVDAPGEVTGDYKIVVRMVIHPAHRI